MYFLSSIDISMVDFDLFLFVFDGIGMLASDLWSVLGSCAYELKLGKLMRRHCEKSGINSCESSSCNRI
jgi:hypothetical protein